MRNRLIISSFTLLDFPLQVDESGKSYPDESATFIEVNFLFESSCQRNFFNGKCVVEAPNKEATSLEEIKNKVLEFLKGVE
jgi:hypothetical protein